jgi:hypothetical protein
VLSITAKVCSKAGFGAVVKEIVRCKAVLKIICGAVLPK